MVIITGKTCSGKSSVANTLNNQFGYKRVVTYTTRQPREGEIDGVDYHYISNEEFEKLKAEEFFFETTSYNVASGETWHYGTSKESLANDAVIVMNPEGMKKVRKLIDHKIYQPKVFYLNIDEGTMWNRLRIRGDSSDEAVRRIEADRKDFADIGKYYDFAITVNNLSINDICEIIDEVNKLI